MPELSRFFGIIVAIFYLDHAPPHVHVTVHGRAKGADHMAKVRISDGAILDGSLPTKARKLVEAWLILHHDELLKAWDKASRGVRPGKIAPLR